MKFPLLQTAWPVDTEVKLSPNLTVSTPVDTQGKLNTYYSFAQVQYGSPTGCCSW